MSRCGVLDGTATPNTGLLLFARLWQLSVLKGGQMRRTAWIVTAVVTAAVVVGGARIMGADDQENSDHGRAKQCSEATVRGDYGIQIQGTRPAPGGLTESVIGIVLRNYDGHGGFSQVSNVKGSLTGTVPDSQG